MILSSSVPPEIRSLLGPSYIALFNAMACRVFRMVIMGAIDENMLSTMQIASAVIKAGSILDHSTHLSHINNRDRQHSSVPHDIALKSRPLTDPDHDGPIYKAASVRDASDRLDANSRKDSSINGV